MFYSTRAVSCLREKPRHSLRIAIFVCCVFGEAFEFERALGAVSVVIEFSRRSQFALRSRICIILGSWVFAHPYAPYSTVLRTNDSETSQVTKIHMYLLYTQAHTCLFFSRKSMRAPAHSLTHSLIHHSHTHVDLRIRMICYADEDECSCAILILINWDSVFALFEDCCESLLMWCVYSRSSRVWAAESPDPVGPPTAAHLFSDSEQKLPHSRSVKSSEYCIRITCRFNTNYTHSLAENRIEKKQSNRKQ